MIALWLGHADIRSTQPYIHGDMTIKERALALVTPTNVKPGRYKPADEVLAYLESLGDYADSNPELPNDYRQEHTGCGIADLSA